jgi:hypothetical protein
VEAFDVKRKYVEVVQRLDFLKPVLVTCVDRVAAITESFPQSEQRYYLEPTLVGLLARAAWSNGLQAITEVKSKRLGSNGREVGGRLDLLVQAGAYRVALEAKTVWDHVLIPANMVSTLSDARREVLSITVGAGEIMLGGVFFVPWWRSESRKRQLEANVLTPLAQLKVDIKPVSYNSDAEFLDAILLAQFATPKGLGADASS